MLNKFSVVLCSILLTVSGLAQSYAPAAGQDQSTAIAKDSPLVLSWAVACTVVPGPQDISNPSLGVVSSGNASLACGPADIAGVVSLGDGGYATCVFEQALRNQQGYDFAVFENSFDDDFLELAFVEVSSDGIHFFRFPSHSLSDTSSQTGTFGSTNPTRLNNLAGKYRGGYGTPFDLEELKGINGLNIDAITHVRVRDVVGSMNTTYATRDAHGNKINDPWPTPFPSGGFDLDAIAVLKPNTMTGLENASLSASPRVFPSGLPQGENLQITGTTATTLSICDMQGRVTTLPMSQLLSTKDLRPGVYILSFMEGTLLIRQRIIIY